MAKPIQYLVNSNGCHICTSHYKDKHGCPTINRKGKMYRMARYLWEQENGVISEGKIIRHKCDNPSCINLEHMEIGTQEDNMKDMVERGRSMIGERHVMAKLTDEQALEVKMATGTQKEIASRYGITQGMVSMIKNGKKRRELL